MKIDKFILLFSALPVVAVLLSACTERQPPAQPKEEFTLFAVRDEIARANLRWAEALKRTDSTALLTLYTENATLMPPNGPVMQGKQEINSFFGALPQMGLKVVDAKLTTVDVEGSSQGVYETGTYLLVIQPPNMTPQADSGKYVTVWHPASDGSWKIRTNIWNTSIVPGDGQ